MRELQTGQRPGFEGNRITPACAGITLRRNMTGVFPQDHPRVCGNYTVTPLNVTVMPGSPPRVRELRSFRPIQAESNRITPACAGITVLVAHCIEGM